MSSTQSKAAAYGVYPQGTELQDVVQTLNQAGFRNDEICLLLAPIHPIATKVRDMRSQASESNSRNALAGLVGWLSKLGAVIISSTGLFIHSQAYLHALLDTNATAYRNWGTLASLGIPEQEAGRLGNRMSEDGGLIYVTCDRTSRSESALEILRRTGALESSCLQSGVA